MPGTVYYPALFMSRTKKACMIVLTVFIVLAIGIAAFVNQPSFGRNPQGERLARVKKSPNYKNGQFQNELPTEVMTGNKSGFRTMWEFLTEKRTNLSPKEPVPSVRTDLKSLPEDKDYMVWFGHSAYMLQLSGKKIIVDPALLSGSPVSFVNRPYPGTGIYSPDDMPDADFLIISHDHWDHLDYKTAMAMKSRIKHIITPLGVGEHFEYWGFPNDILTELDWHESAELEGFVFHCLPARHFSGRSLTRNKTLWGSFVIKTPNGKTIYIGGDSGYGPHFKYIGEHYPGLTLAILENGQYNEDWSQIHTMPAQLTQEMRELKAKKYITVHHSKYTLSKHSWDDPLKAEKQAAEESNTDLAVLIIGQPYEIR
jgi:L-ascorbate metabolism protein UlaG (beta-lactamase superfamily)